MSTLNITHRREHLRDLAKLIETGDWSPPSGLSVRSEALWCALVPARARSPERLLALEVALRAWDRFENIRAHLDGAQLVQTTSSTGVVRLHPLVGAEKEARRDLARMWDELSFNRRGSMDSESLFEIQNPDRVNCGVSYDS